MDSSFSNQVKRERHTDAYHESSSQNLTTHGQEATQGDLIGSTVRDNDGSTFISSRSTVRPFHLASPEDRSTQRSLFGSDQRCADSPLFEKQEVFYEVIAGDHHITQPKLDTKILKGFFEANGRWTTYRRSYFSVKCAVSFLRAIENGLYIQRGGAELQQIHGFSVTVLANGHGKDGEVRKLVQQAPKRHRRSEVASGGAIWLPPITNAADGETAGRSAESRLFSHTFERLQFQKGTPSRGKRRSRQKYYNLVIELHAKISGSGIDKDAHWLKIARRASEPLIIRG
ncbi:hypothetical protein AbraIFM66951_003499 [Aspergillus brasiliensis]|nr:hypothetical protein AbraIFM66951_003499 [Aspergillus brasiliensis]